MFRILRKKRVTFALVAVAALAVAGGAFAYFTSTGTGTGSATVGSATSWTVTAGTATGGPLYSGAGSMVVPYTVKNAGNGYQDLTTTTATMASSGGDVTQGGVAVTGCLAAWFTVVNSPPASVDLAASATTTGSATVTMQDSGTNQDPCEGVSPQITINAS
jgi:hypothetical protein